MSRKNGKLQQLADRIKWNCDIARPSHHLTILPLISILYHNVE